MLEAIVKPPVSPKAKAASQAAQLANHVTPLIRNCWYVAALSSEITRELKERILLETTVLMYRKQDGSAVIMNNRCIHRSFPLSKGRLDGDNVVCGYHGMIYNPEGQCVGMPSLANPPTHARVQGYPVVERGPLVWIWMGDANLASEDKIPNLPWLEDSAWKSVGGEFTLQSNYVAMHENLLDQTHFAILHSDTVGTPDYARSELQVHADGDKVIINRALRNSPPPMIYANPMKLVGRAVDRFSDSRFDTPALHVAHAKIVNLEPQEGELNEYRVNITHLFTPQSQGSIHYWWFNTRDFALSDAEVDTYFKDASTKAYYEDVDALTWIQETYDRAGGPVEELSFGPDRPGLMMRRNLLRLVNAENTES